MKEQGLHYKLLLLILVFYSLISNATEAENGMVKLFFSDAELSRLLNTRPFDEKQTDQAQNRLAYIMSESINEVLKC